MPHIFGRTVFYRAAAALLAAALICGCQKEPEKAVSAAQSQAKPSVSSSQPQSEKAALAAESEKPQPEPQKAESAPKNEEPESKPDKAESQSEAASSEPQQAQAAAEPIPEKAEPEPAQSESASAAAQPESEPEIEVSQPMTSAETDPSPTERATKLTVRMPSATGKNVQSSSSAEIDYSNASQGYIMVKYTGSNQKVKLQITGPNKVTYTYTLHKGGYTSFPLTAGSGSYSANVFENVSGNSYAMVLGCNFSAKLSSPLSPYLYPNQYVNYTAQSNAVAKGETLAAKATSRIGVVQEVYNYIISNVVYDHQKAASVKSGYTPNVDNTLATNKGICFDYAALMATMLRTQDIPTRLEVGYVAGGTYHAWVSVYIAEQGWINGLIQFDGVNWSMMDPTFAASSAAPKSYTTSSYTYSVKYLY